MILFFLYNKDDTWESTERRIDFLVASFEGNVRNWWDGINNDTKTLIKRNVQTEIIKSDREGIERLVNYISDEFLR